MFLTTKSGRKVLLPTDKEDAEINAQIAADPDDFELDDEWFNNAVPFNQLPKAMQAKLKAINKGGRPKLEKPKVFTAIRFDADIVEAFKATGKGWQTRVNDALKDWLKNHAL